MVTVFTVDSVGGSREHYPQKASKCIACELVNVND